MFHILNSDGQVIHSYTTEMERDKWLDYYLNYGSCYYAG